MLVQVMQRHIDGGVFGNASRCPISLALVDLGYAWASTGPVDCIISKTSGHKEAITYLLPVAAQQFVSAFDDGGAVKPMKFILDTIA